MESWQAEERDGRAEQDRVRMIGGEKEQERETDRQRGEQHPEGHERRGEDEAR